ncbi:anthranilate synthase component I family protein [Paenibacillus sp. 1P07SE]|uniref:anthranilate synthase component I family protein n=1 Tax=Paenibacillus sp. 1P07SE TaxID=3132209 RepID=UPI0039A40075
MNITPYPSWESWHASGRYTMLPYINKRPLGSGGARVDSWARAWQAAADYAIVLESGKDGRYTYLGLQPASVIRGKGRTVRVQDAGQPEQEMPDEEPLAAVRRWMAAHVSPGIDDAPPFTGGCAGLWSYDIVRSIEMLPEQTTDDLALPDYLLLRLDELWIIDHEEEQLYCAVHCQIERSASEDELRERYAAAERQAARMARLWEEISAVEAGDIELRERRESLIASDPLPVDVEAMEGIHTPFSREQYESAVRRVQEYIAAGDVFQVNLSVRQSRAVHASPEELYEWLRLFNPSPYMGMLRCPDFQLVSASPELLVKARGGRLAARPIAGTRRRGRDEAEDLRMAEELLTSEKERAEHIMLVDLERNDLGRISEYGSVRVGELLVIERYSHVMHLVSQVEGRLAPGKDAYDVVAATFPGGTITGAPKIRTMEIIEELEPVRRGPYTGSLGYINYNGDMEFNIIIRTMVVQDGQVHIQAGAGIVIDSDPEREYRESLNKAKALWKAIQYSERLVREQTGAST